MDDDLSLKYMAPDSRGFKVARGVANGEVSVGEWYEREDNANWLHDRGIQTLHEFWAAMGIIGISAGESFEVALLPNFSYNEIDGRVSGYMRTVRKSQTIAEICDQTRRGPPRLELLFAQPTMGEAPMAVSGETFEVMAAVREALGERVSDAMRREVREDGVEVFARNDILFVLVSVPVQVEHGKETVEAYVSQSGSQRYRAAMAAVGDVIAEKMSEILAGSGRTASGPPIILAQAVDRFVDAIRSQDELIYVYASDCRFLKRDDAFYYVDAEGHALRLKMGGPVRPADIELTPTEQKRVLQGVPRGAGVYLPFSQGCTTMNWREAGQNANRRHERVRVQTREEPYAGAAAESMLFQQTLQCRPIDEFPDYAQTVECKLVDSKYAAAIHNYPRNETLRNRVVWSRRQGNESIDIAAANVADVQDVIGMLKAGTTFATAAVFDNGVYRVPLAMIE